MVVMPLADCESMHLGTTTGGLSDASAWAHAWKVVQVGTAKLVDVLQAWLLGQGGSPRYVDDHAGPRASAECLPDSTQVQRPPAPPPPPGLGSRV